jgi:hypothetical protein
MEAFFARCRERMVPGAEGYEAYRRCALLECGRAVPDAAPWAVDAPLPPDAPATPPDAMPPVADAAPTCAGVWCDGACCTAYPCFQGKRCRCAASPTECSSPGGADESPAFSPTCCSSSPLCSAQGRRCCFVAALAGGPARTQCLTTCSSELRQCTFAPYLQSDGASSCLPPPFDRSGVPCPF